MSLVTRFFGKTERQDRGKHRLVANPELKDALSLQILLADDLPKSSEKLQGAIRGYHSTMEAALCEVDRQLAKEGNLIGLIGWGDHVVRLVGFDVKMPEGPVEQCVAPSHYPQELKGKARSHSSHVLLYYAGYSQDPLEQYVALAAVAAAFCSLGSIVVLNETAHTSFPASALVPAKEDGDALEYLRTLPLLLLYCGFVKYDVEGVAGVWMRTYGAYRFSMPDLASLTEGHHQGELFFGHFSSIFDYLQDSGAHLAAGHTLQVGEDAFFRFRKPTPEEDFLDSESELLVADVIGKSEINC